MSAAVNAACRSEPPNFSAASPWHMLQRGLKTAQAPSNNGPGTGSVMAAPPLPEAPLAAPPPPATPPFEPAAPPKPPKLPAAPARAPCPAAPLAIGTPPLPAAPLVVLLVLVLPLAPALPPNATLLLVPAPPPVPALGALKCCDASCSLGSLQAATSAKASEAMTNGGSLMPCSRRA